MAQPNPCAHVPAAKIVPMQFDAPRRPVRYEDGWEYYARLGGVRGVKKLTVMAPMVNQSELAFRLLCRPYNTNVCYTPMFHAGLFGSEEKYRADAMQIPADPQTDRPLVVQFCGHDPQTILKAAKLVEHQCDAVDLNLGCPQNIARRGFYGSFLLTHTQLLHDIVSTLHQHLSIPITCKIRRLAKDEDTIALVRMLQEAGAALITIHGRSRLQLKDNVGRCDFDLIRLVKQNCEVPVFANGGIYDQEDVDRCLAYTGVDGVMSSEAILCNPSIFAGVRVDAIEMARKYMKITKELEAGNGTVTEQSMIRAHLFKLLYRQLSVHTDVRDRLAQCVPEDFDSIIDTLAERFDVLPAEERERLLNSVPVWYHRHIPTAEQLVAIAQKNAEKQAELAALEACSEEGLCDAGGMWNEE